MSEITLRVDRVSKRYGSGTTHVDAVRDVSIEVRRGEIVLIMGPSGSGKTTLLSIIGALLRPTDGQVEINGIIVTNLNERHLPDIRLRQIGFIFQDFNLLSALTALENVAIVAELAGAKRSRARERATQLLIQLGLGTRLDFRPEKLSGGEKQRVAIARALVNAPSLILADEPTANLDSQTGREIMTLLQGVAAQQGCSVVIVSHDQRIRNIAQRVLWLEDGRLGTFERDHGEPVTGVGAAQNGSASL